jgi:hypothetical protein
VALGVRAEAAGLLAFSSNKAGQFGVPWTGFIAQPSLGILASQMVQSAAEHYIPYQPAMAPYVDPAEADGRWTKLQTWYAAFGHFWLGTGPFYVQQISWEPKALTLARYSAFPDLAGRWDAFAAAAQPQLLINHSSGAPGSYFSVTGTGFPPDSTASIVANNTILGQTTVDSSGGVAFTLTTEEADPGLYHLRVSVNPAAGLQFTLDEAAPMQPRVGETPLVEVPEGLVPHLVYLPLVVKNY